MSGSMDVSTTELETILKWGDWTCLTCKPRIVSLIAELLRERERADEAVRQVALAKSELEMIRARAKPMQAHAPEKPVYKDGVRYHTPPPTTTGADGFQMPIIE